MSGRDLRSRIDDLHRSDYYDYMLSDKSGGDSGPRPESASRSVGARELKTRLGTYLRQVKEGATLVVTERGRPIAELRPIELGSTDLERALGELVARGILGGEIRERPALTDFEPLPLDGPPASQAIFEDREDRF